MKTVEELAQENSSIAGYNVNIAADVCGKTVYESGFIAGYKKAKEWISVDDELPEEDGEYLCRWLANTPAYTETKICCFISNKDNSTVWIGKDDDEDEYITHWRYID